MESHWRIASRKVIMKVLKETLGMPEKDIRKALREAYPFGERKMYPYKIWREEIKACRRAFTLLQKQIEMFGKETI